MNVNGANALTKKVYNMNQSRVVGIIEYKKINPCFILISFRHKIPGIKRPVPNIRRNVIKLIFAAATNGKSGSNENLTAIAISVNIENIIIPAIPLPLPNLFHH